MTDKKSQFRWDDERQCRVPVEKPIEQEAAKIIINEPRVNSDVNYFDKPGMSSTMLKDYKKSDKHFWAKNLDPNREIDIHPSKAMTIGIIIHLCVLEFDKFNEQYNAILKNQNDITNALIEPEVNKRTKEGKQTLADFYAANEGKLILSISERDKLLANISKELIDYEIALKVRENLLNKFTAMSLLNGKAELEVFWVDDDTGIDCKAKIDLVVMPCDTYPCGMIVELKSTTDASLNDFSSAIYKYSYYNQMAYYRKGFKLANNLPDYPEYIWIAVEKETPYECAFYKPTDEMLELGLKENRQRLRRHKSCVERQTWAGYDDNIQTISLPGYAINKLNNMEDE